MSIREVKPDVWQVRVYWGIEAARPRFLYQVVHGTRADAIAVERKLIAQKGGQLRLAAYNLTLGEFLEAWLIDYIIPYNLKSQQNYSVLGSIENASNISR